MNEGRANTSRTGRFPSLKRSVYSFIGLILLGVFTYFQAVGYIIPSFQSFFEIEFRKINIEHVGMIWPPIITYCFISGLLILAVNTFTKIKSFSEHGLVTGLFTGLVSGVFVGLVIGLLIGLVFGGIVLCVFFWIVIGLLIGFCYGLIWGLLGEF